MKKSILGVALLVVVGFLAYDLLGSEDGAAPFQEVGYFKSDEGDRVFAYQTAEPVDRGGAERILDGAMNTPGRATRAAIYSGVDNPGPGEELTLAENLEEALIIISTPPHDDWDWLLVVNPAGERSIRSQ
ncbi:hypothetical protein [Pseudooceanicola atlanticus]|uniref:hypothetical protein n=1 Tax=Pseudooceanicola atlanticus TaxID=1461694 RepID=UPI0023524BC0|nr:hypothetical protein [Pseudooceanicola atlanticus]